MSVPKREANGHSPDSWWTFIGRRLRFRLGYYVLIGAFSIISLISRAAQVEAHVGTLILVLAIGLTIGTSVGFARRLRWDTASQTVVGQRDLVGVIVLILYFIFAADKSLVVGHWVHNQQEAQMLGFALTSGMIVGRLATLLLGIRRVLQGVRMPARSDVR